jgi:hypothetical protein
LDDDDADLPALGDRERALGDRLPLFFDLAEEGGGECAAWP